jgi:hypothetical protein
LGETNYISNSGVNEIILPINIASNGTYS